jgi:hypothetical protein
MQEARGAGRILGLLFLAIWLVAIAALLAGYGVPVGIGALAGLTLGGMAGAVGSLWLGRGGGRSINLGGLAWSSDGGVSEAPSGEHLAQMRELGELMGIERGPPVAVVPVLQTVEADGLSVQLVAIEICQAGAALTLDARPLAGAPPPASTPHVLVTDDIGTRYRAAGQGQGGGPTRMRYEIAVVPAPPPAARELIARVDRFSDWFPGARSEAIGPWAFTITLPSRIE